MNASTPTPRRARRASIRRRVTGVFLFLAATLVAVPASSVAGVMSVAWDPVTAPDLAGYRVFVGTAPESGDVAVLNVGTLTSVDLVGLPDCATLFVAVKAVDLSGNQSASFSNTVSGMTQPAIVSISPEQLDQGSEDTLVRLTGSSFSPQMDRTDVVFDHEEIRVLDVNWLSCNEVEVRVSVGPFVSNPSDPGYNGDGTTVELVDPAEQGAYPVFASAPDPLGGRILGGPSCGEQSVTNCSAASVLAVDWLPQRSDADASGRVDGWDLARIARANGSQRCTVAEANAGDCDPNAQPLYDATVDLNGDKQVDGVDLTFFASLFGEVF